MNPPHRTGILLPLVVAAVVIVGLSSCDGNDLVSDLGPGPASFDVLQSQVFDQQCVACHVDGGRFAIESGLVLEAGVAYENLVGAEPRNATARAEGFSVVEPGDPERSLLFHKLRADPPDGSPYLGSLMPLGGEPLSVGRLEFVRRWIAAGAPREGNVVDAGLLGDATKQAVREFVPSTPPAHGFQMHLEAFDVQPHSEREIFVHQPVGNAEELWVNRFEIEMRRNSHHFILYAIDPDAPLEDLPPFGEVRDLWGPDGTRSSDRTFLGAPQTFFAGSMTPSFSKEFPEGVALRVPANATMDLNSHYVNRTGNVIPGEVYANVHAIDPYDVEHEAFPLFLNNGDLEIPAGQETTVSRTFDPTPVPLRVFMLTSHMHQRGTEFVIELVRENGAAEEIYRTESWDNPDVIYPDLELAPGETLRSITTYYNPTDEDIRYGLTAEDEMSIIVGYYYRAGGGAAVEGLVHAH